MGRKEPGQSDWEDMLASLAWARRRPRRGRIDLVNAIVFASRCSYTDHPRSADAQTATTELVEQVGGLLLSRDGLTNAEIVKTVDYIVMIACLTDDFQAAQRAAECAA